MKRESDFVKIPFRCHQSLMIRIEKLGLSWPPPEFLVITKDAIREATKDDARKELLVRTRMSTITNEQIVLMNGIARGAEYKFVEELI